MRVERNAVIVLSFAGLCLAGCGGTNSRNADGGSSSHTDRNGACLPGYADCDGVRGNGCETDLQASATSCGACGRVCEGFPHGMGGCIEGHCGALLSCDEGYASCDGDDTNGCETDLRTNADHCGACATVCDSGLCQQGRCVTLKRATFSSLNEDVFQLSCAHFSSCHNRTDHKAGLDLETDPYNALVDADTVGMDGNDDYPKARADYPKRVVPGQPEQSYLWKKLTLSGSHSDDYGHRMPYSNPPLDQATLRRVELWIANGAMND